MSNTHILSEEVVYSVFHALSNLMANDNPTISREAQRLRTLIDQSSRRNGGPAVVSEGVYQSLVILIGKERLS